MLVIADAKIPNAEIEFAPLGEVRVLRTLEMTHENIREADAILVRSETKINAQLLDGTRVRFVGTATIGTDHVDLEYLEQHNVAFASCPGSNANSVAEYILAALLELSHRLGFRLKGKTLGIVGHGNTGSRSALKAQAIGMNVLLNDPPLARLTGDPCYVPLDALMDADIISLHVPLTKTGVDATYHLFDPKRIAAMKRGSILINASRGGVVETQALKAALQSNHLRSAVLDVWEGEPNIDVGLLELVALASPHIAGYSYDGKVNATMMLKQALSEFLQCESTHSTVHRNVELTKIAMEPGEFSLRAIVKQCYDIEKDDESMRELLTLPESDRANYFRGLRTKYRMRREFSNYAIDGQLLEESSAAMLRAIDFNIQ